jgi:hypothetical protein
VVYWLEFLATNPVVSGSCSIPGATRFSELCGSGTGSVNPVRINELLERKSTGPGLENRDYWPWETSALKAMLFVKYLLQQVV